MLKIALLTIGLLPVACWADTVVFKNGEELEGKVLQQDETSILFQVEYGTMRISKEKIARVDPDTPEKLAQREAAAKVGARNGNQTASPVAQPKPAAPAQAKAKGQGAAGGAVAANTQPTGPSWADQYIEWRRARRTGSAQNNPPPNLTSNRERAIRNPFSGVTGTGGSTQDLMRRVTDSSRARTPFYTGSSTNGY